MVAGVCAGVARAIGVDPTWVRLGLVALTVFGGGAGILLYAVGWLVLPNEPEPAAYVPLESADASGDDGGWTPAGVAGGAWVPVEVPPWRNGAAVLGGVLVAVGAALLIARLGLPALAWPVVLVAAGVALALGGGRLR